MNNVSLMKVTGLVVVAAFASAMVNANEEPKTAVSTVSQLVDEKELFIPLDTDKNGLLSKQEVLESSNTLLQKEFAKIDVNSDSDISQEEFKVYLSKVKVL